MSRFRISRRQLLGGVATTAAAGLVPGREISASTNPESGVHSASGGQQPEPSPARTLAWLDGTLSGEDLVRARETLAPLSPRLLEPELLWQWRRDLAQDLHNGARAIAITRWDKAILLKGLAREAALPVRQHRIAHSLFQTEIG